MSKLNKAKQGCYIGDICANAFAYADDIVILSPSCSALRYLISICEIFAKDFEMIFNPDKCTLLIFTNSEFIKNNVNIMLCGKLVKVVNKEKHLGHVLSSEYCHTSTLVNIDNVIRDMKVRTNAIINNFKPVSWKSKVTLFNSQCLSLYGCHIWRLDDSNVEKLCTTWKVCCRRLLGLSPRTRSHLIPQLMETAPILDIIMYRILNFVLDGLNHENNMIKSFFKNSLLSGTSYMSTNVNKIIRCFNINYLELFSFNKNKLKIKLKEKAGIKDWQCNMIEELMYMRESYLEANLDRGEIYTMLEYISTT